MVLGLFRLRIIVLSREPVRRFADRENFILLYFRTPPPASFRLFYLLYLLQYLPVHRTPLRVEKPAPLVEVAHRGLYVRPQHSPTPVALPRVVVHYCHAGIIQRSRHTVDSADEVEVLAVHEVAVVKEQIVRRERGKPQEHEAPREARRIHHPVVARIHEAVAGVLLFLPFFQKADRRNETAEYEVGRTGEQFAQVLRLAARIDDFGQHIGRAGIVVHKLHESRKHIRSESDVGVEHDVVLRARVNRLLHGEVVPLAVAEIRVVDVADVRMPPLKDAPPVVRRVVDDVERPDAARVRDGVQHRIHLGARRVVED